MDREIWTGLLAQDYLKETQPDRYIELQLEDRLNQLMYEVNEQAYERMDQIMEQLLEEHPLNNPGLTMTSYQERLQLEMIAEEIVMNEIVYQPR